MLKNAFLFLLVCAFLSSLLVANLKKGDYHLFFALFFANILSAFIGSLLLHFLTTAMFGSKAIFGATFRIIAYSSLMDIASWIPLLGPLAYFYGLYLIFVGLQETHRLKPRQAGVAVISIVLIVTLLLMSLMLISPEGVKEGIQIFDPESSGLVS